MEEAEKQLEEARREGALDEQEKALRELRQAKAELEEILRQLREEEMKQLLAALEARFTQMLLIQREVYDGTVALGEIPPDRRAHMHEIQSSRLSAREAEIQTALDRVWLLLREDGTTVALPLAVEGLREDVTDVVQRLAETKVGRITQTVEEGIIAALEEVIEALKQAQQELEENQQQQQQSPSGQPQDAPLVDQLAELKMIRAMQVRINRRTEAYRQIIGEEQASGGEMLDRVRQLADRQYRIQQATRDIYMGKNK